MLKRLFSSAVQIGPWACAISMARATWSVEGGVYSVSGSWRENPRKGVQVRRACADT